MPRFACGGLSILFFGFFDLKTTGATKVANLKIWSMWKHCVLLPFKVKLMHYKSGFFNVYWLIGVQLENRSFVQIKFEEWNVIGYLSLSLWLEQFSGKQLKLIFYCYSFLIQNNDLGLTKCNLPKACKSKENLMITCSTIEAYHFYSFFSNFAGLWNFPRSSTRKKRWEKSAENFKIVVLRVVLIFF